MPVHTKNYDVVIIGAGVIGLALARALARAGASVLTVDRGMIGREASWASAGMLAPQCEGRRSSPFTALCMQSLELYPGFAQSLHEETGVDVELHLNGIVRLSRSQSELDEIFTWQSRENMVVDRWSETMLTDSVPGISPGLKSALYFPTNGQVENRKLVHALTRFCEAESHIHLRPHSSGSRIVRKNGRVSAAIVDGQTVRASSVVVAAGVWSSDSGFAMEDLPGIRAVKGQMACLDGTGSRLDHVIYSDGVYLVPRMDGRILVGASVEEDVFDHRVDQTMISSLVSRAAGLVPAIKNMPLITSWAGLRPKGPDEYPILGGTKTKGLYVATGHFRNGVLLAPVTAEIMTELILGGKAHEALRHFGLLRFQKSAEAPR